MEPEVLASEERGSGPALVFIHGFPLDARAWRGQVTALPKHATCYAIDLRGHGMSAGLPVEGSTIDLYADDVARTLEELGVASADVAGLSMGGYVALALWKRHPERVRSLLMVDTKAEGDSDEAKKGREATAELARAEGMGALWAKLRGVLLGDAPGDDVVAAVERMILELPAETGAADALAMRDREDFSGALESIDVPVTWIHGVQDKLMPMDGAKATVDRLPNARLVTVEQAGHLSPIEQPAAVNEAIVAHLGWVRGS